MSPTADDMKVKNMTETMTSFTLSVAFDVSP